MCLTLPRQHISLFFYSKPCSSQPQACTAWFLLPGTERVKQDQSDGNGCDTTSAKTPVCMESPYQQQISLHGQETFLPANTNSTEARGQQSSSSRSSRLLAACSTFTHYARFPVGLGPKPYTQLLIGLCEVFVKPPSPSLTS